MHSNLTLPHVVTSQAKLDILQTPDIYIDMRSTAREVQAWLKAKQFSSRFSLIEFNV